jgi:hypothetical protein
MNVFKFQKLPPLGNPQVTINMNKKTKLNKNSEFKPLKCQWPILSCKALQSQKQCNLPTPLTTNLNKMVHIVFERF